MSQPKKFADTLVLETLRRQARRSTIHMLKCRARAFSRRPFELEALYPGLSNAPPRTMIAIAEYLMAQAGRDPHRWFGFGGETETVNAKAALLLGRTLRRRALRDRDEIESDEAVIGKRHRLS